MARTADNFVRGFSNWLDSLDTNISLAGYAERLDGETFKDYIDRCFVPVPRYDDGSIVDGGDPLEGSYVAGIEIDGPGGSYGDWRIRLGNGELIEGTYSQRVERGDTQEAIDAGAMLYPHDYYSKYISRDVSTVTHDEVRKAVTLDLLRRQRELDARAMGGWR